MGGRERSERQNLSRLRDEPAQKPAQGSTITPEDILEGVAERASAPVASVRQTIEREADKEWERVAKTLATGISAEGHEWLACLASYLAGCSDEEAEKLAQAIRTARNTRKD